MLLKGTDRARPGRRRGRALAGVTVLAVVLSAVVVSTGPASAAEPGRDEEPRELTIPRRGVSDPELLLAVAAATPTDVGTLVRTIDTSRWVPASPDPSGIVYIPSRDRLQVVDSEVEEVTGAGYHGVNMWGASRTGTVQDTGTTYPAFSKEPTGLGFDPATNSLFISDDSSKRVWIDRPGPDGRWGTSDDVLSSINVGAYGSADPEDPEFDPATGHLFVLDGIGTDIYDIDPVDGVFGNGNDSMRKIEVGGFGPSDFEGLSSDPSRGTLLLGARTTKQIFEITKTGSLVRIIDVSGVSGLRFISGLAMAPASDGSGVMNYWIVDRAVDNGANANENDGKIFEISVAGSAPVNDPPTVTNPGTRTNVVGDAVSFQIVASDPNGDAVESYGASGLPAGLTVNASTGLISGTTTTAAISNVTISATDSKGATGTTSFTWSVTTVPNDPPNVTNPGTRTNVVGDVVSYQIQATDPNGDPIASYAAAGLPAGLSVSTSTGLITGTTTSAGSRTVTFSATDSKGATGSATFTWSVTDTTPPSAPTGLDATVSTTEVSLAWSPNAEADLAGYRVYRSLSASGPWGQPLNPTLLTSPSFADRTGAANTTYFYEVRAVDTSGNASGPASVSATRSVVQVGSSTASTNSGTSISLARPSAVAAGDVLIVAVSSSASDVSVPDTWNLLQRGTTSNGAMRLAVFWKAATANEPTSSSWSVTGKQSLAGTLVAYRGAAPTAIASLSVNASSTQILAAQVTTAAPSSALVGFFGTATNTTISPAAGMVERAEVLASGKKKLGLETADQIVLAPGATGTRAASAGVAATNIGVLLALTPA